MSVELVTAGRTCLAGAFGSDKAVASRIGEGNRAIDAAERCNAAAQSGIGRGESVSGRVTERGG